MLLCPIADKRSNEPWNWFVGSSIPGAFFSPVLENFRHRNCHFLLTLPSCYVIIIIIIIILAVVVVVDVVISINAVIIVVFITTTRINLFYFSVATKLLENKQQVLCRPPWDGPF